VTLDLDTILVLNHRLSTAYDNKASGYWLRRLDKTLEDMRRPQMTLENWSGQWLRQIETLLRWERVGKGVNISFDAVSY
jgi:hypothetical protein